MLRKKLSVTILVAVCSVLAFVIGIIAASTASVGVNGVVQYTAIGNVKATISLSHTAGNDVYAVSPDGEGSAVGGQVATITFAGTEKNASGSFNLTGTADGTVLALTAAEGANEVLYSYTLTITNNYTSQDAGAKKNLKVTFAPPVENNAVSTTLQSGYSWNNNSTILNVGATVEIVVTFLVNDLDNSLEANLASNITLEATGDSGQDFSPVILTLNAAGGDLVNSTANVYHGTTYGELPTPIRADYTFLGWYTGENGTGTKITSTTTVDKANTTLYAHWVINSRTVTFDYNDGTSSTANDVTINVNYNTTIPAGDIPTPIRDKYDFLGWYTEEGCQTLFDFSTPIISNITLYAKYTLTTYNLNITFSGDGCDTSSGYTIVCIGDNLISATRPGNNNSVLLWFGGENPVKSGTVEKQLTKQSVNEKILPGKTIIIASSKVEGRHYLEFYITLTSGLTSEQCTFAYGGMSHNVDDDNNVDLYGYSLLEFTMPSNNVSIEIETGIGENDTNPA